VSIGSPTRSQLRATSKNVPLMDSQTASSIRKMDTLQVFKGTKLQLAKTLGERKE